MQFQTEIIEDVEHVQLVSDDQILFSVAPKHGARLTHLNFIKYNKVHSLLWEVSPEDCKTGAWSKNELLFPFPNRIDGGQYTYEGENYQLPINENANNNALHGMIANVKFQIESLEVTDTTGTLTLVYKYKGNEAYYPFPFHFAVTYEYAGMDSFSVSFEVKNTGTRTLPFGLGWHPYFKLGKDGLKNLSMIIPKTDHLLLGDRMIPTGKEEPFEHTMLQLKDWALDDCFRLKETEHKVELKSDELTLKMEGSPEFKYLQLFTPEGFGTVAIEPMTSGVDVFNNLEGVRYLEPSGIFQVSFKISG